MDEKKQRGKKIICCANCG